DYGRFTLCLHSGPLPENIGKHVDALGHFVDAVYERLPAPVAYQKHPYWEDGFRRFLPPEQRRELLESLSAQSDHGVSDCSNEQSETTGTEATEPVELDRKSDSIQVARRSWLADLYRNIFGSLPYTKPLHPYHTILHPVVAAVQASRLTAESRSL